MPKKYIWGNKVPDWDMMRSQEGSLLKNLDKPIIAGSFMIIIFVISIFAGGNLIYLGKDIVGRGNWVRDTFSGAYQVCGFLILIFGMALLLGAICAIKQVYWPIAFGASILGIFTIGPYYLGSILSIVALILLVISRGKFRQTGRSSAKGPPTARSRGI